MIRWRPALNSLPNRLIISPLNFFVPYTATEPVSSCEDKLAVAKALDKHFEENSVKSDVSGFYEESRDANREQIYVLYGGLFFIGIFLGTMFLMVTVMIIFYKQISEEMLLQDDTLQG